MYKKYGSSDGSSVRLHSYTYKKHRRGGGAVVAGSFSTQQNDGSAAYVSTCGQNRVSLLIVH